MKWEFYSLAKFECPECHELRFVRMVNEEGEFYPENVGRCDREDSCGYMYHASQWLKDNPKSTRKLNSVKVEQPKKKIIDGYYSFSEELWDAVKSSESKMAENLKNWHNYTSEFKNYLINDLHFASEYINLKMDEYKMVDSLSSYYKEVNGVEKLLDKTSVKYFYVSYSKEIRAVEQVFYEGFKRSKNWHNEILNKEFNRWGVNRKVYDIDTTEINWCLFGEHLISDHPEKPVIVVEGVKTAFGMALYYPEYNWVATGSSNRLIHLNFLSKHKVLFLPDAGLPHGKSYAEIWKERIKKMYGIRFEYNVYEFNDNCSTEEIKNGYDILDLQIKDPLRAKSIISSIFNG